MLVESFLNEGRLNLFEGLDLKKVAETPEELYKYLSNKFEYHFDEKKYIIKPVEEFQDKMKGTCWDITDFEYWYFNTYFIDLKAKAWYIQIDNDDKKPTHSWVTYLNEKGKVVAFEVSWQGFKGLHEYKDEKAMIKEYKKRFFESKKKEFDPNKDGYMILTFTPPSVDELDDIQYMQYVYANSKFIEGDKYLEQWHIGREWEKMELEEN